jgi:hypothetical protein
MGEPTMILGYSNEYPLFLIENFAYVVYNMYIY